MLLVPETAREGNSNTYDLRVEHTSQFFTLNGTSLIVSDNLGIELVQENKGIVSVPTRELHICGSHRYKHWKCTTGFGMEFWNHAGWMDK